MKFLIFLLDIYGYLIIASAVLSWINVDPRNPAVKFVYSATEPVLMPLRKLIPPIANIDFSPFAAFILLQFLIKILSGL
ncbi:MAG: YggT family protein [Candidatus Schekmanbacteria bacterium]|nr:MAG: YggT family protein [Candidatus Schekmanbacteria bacterium]